MVQGFRKGFEAWPLLFRLNAPAHIRSQLIEPQRETSWQLETAVTPTWESNQSFGGPETTFWNLSHVLYIPCTRSKQTNYFWLLQATFVEQKSFDSLDTCHGKWLQKRNPESNSQSAIFHRMNILVSLVWQSSLTYYFDIPFCPIVSSTFLSHVSLFIYWRLCLPFKRRTSLQNVCQPHDLQNASLRMFPLSDLVESSPRSTNLCFRCSPIGGRYFSALIKLAMCENVLFSRFVFIFTHFSPKAVVFNPGIATRRGGVNQFWRGRD